MPDEHPDAAPPPPANATWAPPPGATGWAPPPASAPVGSTSGVRVLRVPVALVAVLAVLAVVGVLIWDGGDALTATPGGSRTGSGVDLGGTSGVPGVGRPGSAGATVNGEPYVSVPEPPLDPLDLAPAGATRIPPLQPDTAVAWRVPGPGEAQLAKYRQRFPVAGYELGEQRIMSGRGGGAWDVVVAAEGYQPASGLLYIGPDPQDPSATIVEYGTR